METVFLALVTFMLGLAVFDLVVGVSNDAVNFLTSAVGSRAATIKTIMVIASAGVFVGAASAGGMMEIAKKGLFNPALFSFQHIIFIYVVVMLTDIFLLDCFNSMKLPTSTSISIVFELLGASLATSFLIVYSTDQSVSEWLGYINTQKALHMIVAIFVSVAIAFVFGCVVQYLLRAAVTYDYKRYMRLGGSVFGGLSVFVVANFIINVAFKHSPLKGHPVVLFLSSHMAVLFFITFSVSTCILFILSANKKFDTFQFITLFGTFALAMAFASNDLVNFIGVPLAGLEGFTHWKGSGLSPQAFTMEVFNAPSNMASPTPLYLIAAGAIMILTLWMSKKARNVIQTTVNLSRQSDGVERFNGNALARGMVRLVIVMAKEIAKLVPGPIRQTIERRYALKPSIDPTVKELPPAFDYVRASVNLIVAASLISLGTRLKLPLSTTYVTFMVVMGTSLADRAWNRDSAVYRVAGVLTVVGGWFITAIAALVLSAVFAMIVFHYTFAGIGVVVLIVGIGICLVNKFSDNEPQPEITVELPDDWFLLPLAEIQPNLSAKLKEISDVVHDLTDKLVDTVLQGDKKLIRDLEKQIVEQNRINLYYRATLNRQLRTVDPRHLETGAALLSFYFHENEILLKLNRVVHLAKLHVLNGHMPLDQTQVKFLTEYLELLHQYNQIIQSSDGDAFPDMSSQLKAIRDKMHLAVTHQIKGLTDRIYSYKNSNLFLSILIGNMQLIDSFTKLSILVSTKGE